LETASIALQAALTGHLVFTTLHTNDAAGTVARLQALGEKPVNIAPALNMAVAQRLVRRLCQECAEKRPVSNEDLSHLKENLGGLHKNIKLPPLTPAIGLLKPKGCKICNFTGFKGRIAVFEAFLIDEEMEQFILKSPSIGELRKRIGQKGMVSMHQDGLLKALEGITTIEEVVRATGEQ
jgi:type II secretory ATPase GspE/PulE/Tfp pilus assembly ATPase PilB-like protein